MRALLGLVLVPLLVVGCSSASDDPSGDGGGGRTVTSSDGGDVGDGGDSDAISATTTGMMTSDAGGDGGAGDAGDSGTNPALVPTLPLAPKPVTGGGATYYVNGPSGSDGADGKAQATAFKTLQHASDLTAPGDTVYVMNGTYSDPSAYAPLWVTRGGTASAWILYQAYPGQHPVIQVASTNWAGIAVSPPQNSTGSIGYVVLDGFEVSGNSPNLTLAQATSDEHTLTSPTNSSGIALGEAFTSTASVNVHHVTVQNCVSHDNPAGGIGSVQADFITVQDSVTYGNAFYSPYAASGISLYEMRNQATDTGYRNFVLRNTSYGNVEKIGNANAGYTITDGNGIIIDDNDNTQSSNVLYTGRTLVANNLVYGNGGSGIHAFHSSHVDFLYNTAYSDNAAIKEGEIFANVGTDVLIEDNVMYARTGSYVSSNCSNTKVTSDFNVLFNGASYGCGTASDPLAAGAHDLVADPKLVKPALSGGDFHLQAGSPAIDHGNSAQFPSNALGGGARAYGKAPDTGCYESDF